jgi:predicted transcriptional regulator
MTEAEAIHNFQLARGRLDKGKETVQEATKELARLKTEFITARHDLCLLLGLTDGRTNSRGTNNRRGRRNAVLEAVQSIGPCTRMQIEEACGLSTSMANYYLKKLQRSDEVLLNESGKYEAMNKAEDKGVPLNIKYGANHIPPPPNDKAPAAVTKEHEQGTRNGKPKANALPMTQRDKVLQLLGTGPKPFVKMGGMLAMAVKPLADLLQELVDDGEVVREQGVYRLPS